jgi:hypothetical protein
LSGGQTQIEAKREPFRHRVAIERSLQMHQFGTKGVKPFSQLFDLVIDFFFYGGGFVSSVADMDIHQKASEYGSRSREVSGSYLASLHPERAIELT